MRSSELSSPLDAAPRVWALIPTYQRATKAAASARTLARQDYPAGSFTAVFVLDGEDPRAAAAIAEAWTGTGGRAESLLVHTAERAGYNAARNAGLALIRERLHGSESIARGRDLLLSLNDDILAEPDLVTRHAEAQAEALRLGHRGALVSGSADWIVPQPADDTLMDRLVRETSMVFFYDQMAGENSADPYRDWGFRHCYGLNFSTPLWAVLETGGFTAFPLTYGHDDIEMAWRLNRRFGFPVWHRPAAKVMHDHRYRAADLLDREFNLGVASWRFARKIPEFGRAVFNRDVTSREELEYSRQFITREAATAERLRETFLALDHVPASSVQPSDTPDGRVIIHALYQQHLLLKRWTWRKGLLHASELDSAREPDAPAHLPS